MDEKSSALPSDDLLDGCSLDFAEDPDDDETAAMRPLFPGDQPSVERLAGEWRELFGGDRAP